MVNLRKNKITVPGGVRTGAIALALLTTVLVPSYGRIKVAEAAPGAKQSVPAEEVSESTEQYIGETITMRGEIAQTNDYPNSFTIDDNRFFGGENILVINATGAPITLPAEDIQVQVTGEVRQFQIAEIERDFDLTLDPNYYVEYENQPAIVAESIALSPEVGELTENPDVYYGQPLSLEGEVEEVMGNNMFTLDDDELGGNELLVINMATGEMVNDGESVVVTGEIRPFVVADLERDYNLTWDLDIQRQLEAEYQNKPVFIAEGVFPSAAK